MRVELLKEPCRRCGGALTPEHISDPLYWWYRCVNCGARPKADKPKPAERSA